MATGAEILSYHGDVGLGLGSSPGVSALPDKSSLETINGTVRDLMLLNQQNNLEKFKQKVNDRNQLQALIYNNQVQTGEIDPNDRKYVDSAKSDVEKAYLDWGGDMNDTKGYAKYQAAVSRLRDTATHAQTRWASLAQMRQQIAQETLPWKKQKMQDWYDQQEKKGFEAPIDPYQQQFDFSVKPILDNFKTVTGITRGKDGFFYNQAHADYGATQKAMEAAFTENGETAEDMRQFRQRVQDYDQPQLLKFINSTNAQIKKYNDEIGEKSGNVVQPLQVHQDAATGKWLINESTTDFAAKYALASQEQYVSQTPNKDMNDIYDKRIKAVQEQERLGIMKDRNAAAWFTAETGRKNEQLREREDAGLGDAGKQVTQLWDNILPQMTPADPEALKFIGGEESGQFAIDASKLPPSFSNVGGIDANGKPIPLKPIGSHYEQRMITDPATGKQKPYLDNKGKPVYDQVGGVYVPEFFVPKGTVIGGKAAGKDLDLTQGQLYKLYKSSNFKGDFNQFVMDGFNNKKFDYNLRGENGTATRGSAYMSQVAIGNKLTKKGQPNPFNADESTLFPQTDDETSPDDTPAGNQ
jgi:hypothetical protein